MDFHVWAKLDNDGRIESVQSSCAQTPQPQSPVWPFMPSDQRGGGLILQDNEKSEKFVPYIEKKNLVYKLDAKVDEMSVMVRQLADLSERNKLQKKLIKQYEDKIASQEQKIKTLEAENAKVKSEQMTIGRIQSGGSMTFPKCFKSSRLDVKMVCNLDDSGKCSSWSGDSIGTKEMTNRQKGVAHVEPVEEVDSARVIVQRLEKDNYVDNCDNVDMSSILPSSLSLGIDISSSDSGTDLDLEGHFNFRRRESSTRNGYSYVEKQASLVLPSEETHQDKEQAFRSNIVETEIENTEECTTNVHHGPLGHVDNEGYLDMSRFPLLNLHDGVHSSSKEKYSNVQLQKSENELTEEERKSRVDNEAVHSTWIDINNGHYISEDDSSRIDRENLTLKYLTTDEYMDPKVCSSDYIDIPDENVPTRPPLPLPRQISSSRKLHRPRSNSRDMIGPMSDSRYFPQPKPNSKDAPSPRLRSGNIHQPMSDSGDFPRRRSESTVSNSSNNSEIFDRQWLASSSSSFEPSDNNAASGTCSRRTTLSVSCMSSSEPAHAPRVTTRSTDSSDAHSTHSSDNIPPRADISFVSPSASLSSDQNAGISMNTAPKSPSTNDTRKDDHLNRVLKDMRTTMEWHKAKKRLISQSHHNTADQVELLLRSVVQDMYEAYRAVQKEMGSRLKRYSNERIMKKIQVKIGKAQTEHCLSEEFMKKCLDLVMLSCQV